MKKNTKKVFKIWTTCITRFKSYKHFHRKSSTGQNEAWWSRVTLFHTSGWKMLKYIIIQNLNQIYRPVQELWALYQKSSTCQNNARWSLVTFFLSSGWTMLKYISKQNLNKMYHAVQEFRTFSLKELNWPEWCSVKTHHHFANQWLDNVKIHKYFKTRLKMTKKK